MKWQIRELRGNDTRYSAAFGMNLWWDGLITGSVTGPDKSSMAMDQPRQNLAQLVHCIILWSLHSVCVPILSFFAPALSLRFPSQFLNIPFPLLTFVTLRTSLGAMGSLYQWVWWIFCCISMSQSILQRFQERSRWNCLPQNASAVSHTFVIQPHIFSSRGLILHLPYLLRKPSLSLIRNCSSGMGMLPPSWG